MDDLKNRARKVLRQLEDLLGASKSNVATISEGATIEVIVEPGLREKPADADQEILDVAERLQRITDRSVMLLTLDTAMRVRAQAVNLAVQRPPHSFLHQKELEAQADAERTDTAPSESGS